MKKVVKRLLIIVSFLALPLTVLYVINNPWFKIKMDLAYLKYSIRCISLGGKIASDGECEIQVSNIQNKVELKDKRSECDRVGGKWESCGSGNGRSGNCSLGEVPLIRPIPQICKPYCKCPTGQCGYLGTCIRVPKWHNSFQYWSKK